MNWCKIYLKTLQLYSSYASYRSYLIHEINKCIYVSGVDRKLHMGKDTRRTEGGKDIGENGVRLRLDDIQLHFKSTRFLLLLNIQWIAFIPLTYFLLTFFYRLFPTDFFPKD